MKLLMAATTSMASAALMLAIVAVLGRGDSVPAPAAAGTPGADPGATPAAAEAQVLAVDVGDLFIRPDALEASTSAPVTLNVTNAGGIPHDLEVVGVGKTPALNGGESHLLELGMLDAGTYQILCTIPGHADAGMRGTLVVSDSAVSGGGGGGGDHGGHAGMTQEEMDEAHLAVIAAFPAETEGLGGQLLEPRIEDGVKVFELTASEFEWEVEPGVWRAAMGYNGQVPGPEIRVDLGDTVRVIIHNEMSESTAIHFHGQIVPNSQDGVPGLTQPMVKPGDTYTYEFTTRNSGSHMYHSHVNAAIQVPSGLFGAFIVLDENEPEVDQDIVMIVNDGPLGYTLNGKGFPATQPIVAKQGERIRIRYMNEGIQIHPMHLHGPPQLVYAKDGYPLPQPYLADNVLVSPGDRVDVIIEADEVGVWAFHCHILTHVEAPDGMFGMVTVLIVEE